MIRLFKPRITPYDLGALETQVMNIVWTRGETCVRDAVGLLTRPLAYTTVMTTLDRLYKKGLLDRRKSDRAFLYSTRLSRQEWERARAENVLADFLAGPRASRELLLSSFLDAVGEHDAVLLEQLE